MISFEMDYHAKVVHLQPDEPLSEHDFNTLSSAIDPVIESSGFLNGIVIEMDRFPGWDNFSAMLRHFQFIRDHYGAVRRIALVTDDRIATFMDRIGSHFDAAEVRRFPRAAARDARAWAGEASAVA